MTRWVRLVLPAIGLLVIGFMAANVLQKVAGDRREAATRSVMPKVGLLMPDFNVKKLDGSQVTLGSLDGKPIFINFWASWCGPCQAEMPDIQSIYRERGQRISLLTINEGESVEVIKAFMKDNNLSLPVALDENGDLHGGWNFRFLPTTIIADRDGKVCLVEEAALNKQTMLNALDLAESGC